MKHRTPSTNAAAVGCFTALLALSLIPSSVLAQKCNSTNVTPFPIRMIPWVFSRESADYNPNVGVGIGDPDPQQLAISIALRFDHTYIWNKGSGEAAANGYNRVSAKGWKQTVDYNDVTGKEMPQAQGVGGTDAFRVYSTNTSSYSNLTAFPFYVITKHEEDAQPAKPNAIGLGPNSTFLDAMWRSGNIPGHGFGLEMGVYTWPKQDRLNTEIVFGGYNKNKIDGTVYEQDILYKNMEDPTRGALVVTVVDIALDVGKGEGPVSVFTKLSENKNTTQGQKDLAFEAQLETRVPWLEFPSEIAEKIRAMGNFTWDDQAKGYTKVPSGFAGTLTVRLSNGLEVKLDTDLFSRAWNHSSATMSPLRVYKNFPLASGSAFPTLGSRFMAAVYTMVNYETKDLALGRAGTLRLAKLNKGANSSEQDFVSFCAPIPPAGHGTNNTETIDPDTTDGPGGAEKTENSKKKTPSKGVIIGAAVGGVAFIILVALLFKVFHRRRSTQTFATPLMELYGSDGHRGGQMQPHTQEFPAGAPPVEMYFDNSEYYPKPSPGELPVKEYVHPVYTEETIAQTREMSSLRSPPPQGRF